MDMLCLRVVMADFMTALRWKNGSTPLNIKHTQETMVQKGI